MSDLMIDTVRFKGRFLDPSLVPQIAFELETFVKYKNDMILYEFTSGQLQGSFDHRISFKIKTKDWVYDESLKAPVLAECVAPYFEVELSLHKFFLGHNCFGFDDDLSRIHTLYDYLEVEIFKTRFIDRSTVELLRIDIAEVYKFSNADDVRKIFHNMQNQRKYRTKPLRFKDNGIYFPSTVTTFKIYNKHDEFIRHDAKRLKKIMSEDDYNYIFNMSKNCVRLECEIHKKKLNELYGKHVYVEDLIMKKIVEIKDLYLKEKQRLIFEARDDVAIQIVGNVHDVLLQKFNSSKANNLYAFWMSMVMSGEEETRRKFKQSYYYASKKIFRELGIPFYEYGFNQAEELSDEEFPKIDI